MKIAIVGFGRMGQLVRRLITEGGKHEVVAVIDPYSKAPEVTAAEVSRDSLSDADVAIDFTVPSSAAENVKLYSEMGVAAVVGTTGWYKSIEEVKALAGGKAKLICSGNFSVGVLLFLRIVSCAAELMDKVEEYDAAVLETHHRMKADAPSGTALMIADRILKGMRCKTSLVLGNPDGKIKPEELQVSSLRAGSDPGEHTVVFDGPADTITLDHHARSREGFARGALHAAEWLVDQEPGVYTMDDYMSGLLGE